MSLLLQVYKISAKRKKKTKTRYKLSWFLRFRENLLNTLVFSAFVAPRANGQTCIDIPDTFLYLESVEIARDVKNVNSGHDSTLISLRNPFTLPTLKSFQVWCPQPTMRYEHLKSFTVYFNDFFFFRTWILLIFFILNLNPKSFLKRKKFRSESIARLDFY